MQKLQAIKRAKEILRESRIYDGVLNLMLLDMRAHMPPDGRPYRVESSAYLESRRAQLFMTGEARELANWLRENAALCQTDIERAVARRFLALHGENTAVPPELLEEISLAHFEADAAWMEARRLNDYTVFRPALKKMYEVKRRAAEAVNPHKHPLEVLMNKFDEDLTVDTCAGLLGELKRGVSAVLFKVLPASREVDDSFLKVMDKDRAAIDSLARYLCHCFGYTESRAGYAKIVHPWSATIGPRDSRVTTYRYKDGLDNLFTAAHEMGHSLYSIGSSEQVIEAGIWGGMKGSAQESQSRFYENIICRSPEFWQFFFPFMQERFPQLERYDSDTFFRAALKVQPSLIRTSADELTYSLHPIIRFEIEKDLFDGRLNLDRLPEIWGDKYEESLGIRPENDLEGCLQDVHWTEDFGKFQSYPMGNIFDGQLLQRILAEMPDFYANVSRGQFTEVLAWFVENVHQHGFTYPTMETMRRACGCEISAQPFVEYIKNKYFTLYGIKE